MGTRKSGGGSRGSGKPASKSSTKSGGSSSTTPKNDRYVVKHPDGWAVKAPKASKSSSVHKTQADAEKKAKEVVSNLGGGEVRVQGKDGKWRDSDTVAPGNDPCPPKDTKG